MDFKELEAVKVNMLLIKHGKFKELYQTIQVAVKSEQFRNNGFYEVETSSSLMYNKVTEHLIVTWFDRKFRIHMRYNVY